MKVLRSWLQKYIDIKLSDTELSDVLSLSGTAVEAMTQGIDERVVVVEIRAISPHPQADRLRLATVFDGKSDLTVVCGAPNIEVGQKVPLAQIGASLPGGVIEKAKIRGIVSEGMLCAEDELGLGSDHNGIVILPNEYTLGTPLKNYIKKETIFELEITPNRGDCLSHLGVAREIAANTETVIKRPPIDLPTSTQKISEIISVEVKDTDLCSQYQARIIEHIEVKESPQWLKDELRAIGAKPINNIVDATNYIMFDLGQPLHAFDATKVGKVITVRKAQKGEKITTLDNAERSLESSTLLITDENGPLAIAGVMGGKDSEISTSTKTVILESASFDAKSIRKTAKSLNLSTEASYRFERGIDDNCVEYALNKAAKLIAEISGGKVLSGISRVVKKTDKQAIKIEYSKINSLLGIEISNEKINHILKLLGFEIQGDSCTAPSWRHDINVWQDLAEEIGRIYGYAKITPSALTKTLPPKQTEYYYTEFTKDIFRECGFSEVMSYPFLSAADIAAAGLKPSSLLEVANPIQEENKYLRNSLVPNLLKVIAKNSAFDSTLIFEIGNVFAKESETKVLAFAAAGKGAEAAMAKIADQLKSKAGIKKIDVSELSRDQLQRFKVRKPVVYIAEVSISDQAKTFLKNNEIKLKSTPSNIKYRPVSKFPALTRDLAFIVDKSVSADSITEAIYTISPDANRVELFDEFSSDKFGKGKKNVAFHLFLQKLDRTMTDTEADEIIKAVVKSIEKKFDAKLRA